MENESDFNEIILSRPYIPAIIESAELDLTGQGVVIFADNEPIMLLGDFMEEESVEVAKAIISSNAFKTATADIFGTMNVSFKANADLTTINANETFPCLVSNFKLSDEEKEVLRLEDPESLEDIESEEGALDVVFLGNEEKALALSAFCLLSDDISEIFYPSDEEFAN